MLTQMRALSQNIFGRLIMAVVLGFIILSFAVWGIGDRFTNFNAGELAQVGSTRITVTEYRNAYQTQLQQMQQKAKRGITNEEAHRLGLDRQVLARLLTDAVLDQEAARLGLAIGDKGVAETIVNDPLFRGATGKFDQMRFASLLQNNGLTEATYVKDQRAILLRQDVSEAVIGGLTVPKALESAINRYQSEVRDIDYFTLPPSAAGTVPKPSDADLKTYYTERAHTYLAPEYRKLVVLSVVPVDLIKPDAISDADVKRRYEEMKAARFIQPERRTVQQLVFADTKAAEAAKTKLDKGATFDSLVADEKKSQADVSLGTITKDEVADKAVADAAFSLKEGETGAPVKGQFGIVLVHVPKVFPMRQQPLMEVSASLKDELAIVRAKTEAAKLRDTVEDQRSGGKTLTEAAASVGLKTRTIDAVDAQGRDKAHKPVEGLVDGPALLKSAFATEVGADTEMIQTANGGDVWFETAGIEAAHQLPLDAVKPQVEAGWRADEVNRRLAAESDKLVAAINGGKSLESVAAEAGKQPVMKANNVPRGGAPNLPPTVTSAIFGLPAGKAGAASGQGAGRIIFKVEAARVPPPNPKDPNVSKLMDQVKNAFDDDVIAQYLAQVQTEIGVKINNQALQTALGGDSGS